MVRLTLCTCVQTEKLALKEYENEQTQLNDFSGSIISTFSCRCYANGCVAATNTTTEVHATKAADGKCGEAKCGANKMKKHEKSAEAKCGAAKKAADGKCGATKKAADGKCGADKKVADGKCGAK